MKNIKIIYIALLGMFFSTGCSDWLDVSPSDKVLEDTLYESESGINSVINGIYVGMADNNLYGANLTTTSIEFLGQQYYTTILSTQNQQAAIQLAEYDYTGEESQKVIASVWKNMYARILETNKFLEKIADNEVISKNKKSILMGEAYGLRAFMHFDLLRLFGPVYSETPEALAIPYNTVTDGTRSPQLPANQVIKLILDDLDRATAALVNDPIITEGALVSSVEDSSLDFYRFRNRRMNYYAVKALQARVLLYAGEVEKASTMADEVIAVAEEYFPWTTPAEYRDSESPDLIFSNEVIFGIHNQDMYSNWRKYFSPTVKAEEVYGANLSVLQSQIFTGDGEHFTDFPDLRSKAWVSVSDMVVLVSSKYKDNQKYASSPINYFQPLIRLSEMYYIKTEEALLKGDEVKALEWLEIVRSNRLVTPMPDTSSPEQIEAELEKEYLKEFYGEGQSFYYFKRKNKENIPNANVVNTTIEMTKEKYIIPIPDEEIEKQ